MKTWCIARGASTIDPNIGMQYGYTTVPHLASVDITGPYNATGPGDTPSRRRIFVCHPSAPADEIPCARQICLEPGSPRFSPRARRMPISSRC